MKLLITTQVRENYGAHDWDGVGECPQYWKSKGGNEYVLRDFKGSDGQAEYAVEELRDQFESNNDYFHEYGSIDSVNDTLYCACADGVIRVFNPKTL